mmetsp:Transcript_2342/g.7912  ORF Transcript_2342/g.7912 Transcript_2342/m.7912 type:complete len:219 (-) Transcript_2342:176-832(-)
MAAADGVAQAHQDVLDHNCAPNGASRSQVLVAAKKRRRLSEQFHESGGITDGELARAYVSESAALEGFVVANAPAGAAAPAPAWFGPAINQALSQALAPVNARLDGIDARLDGIDARLDGIDARFDRIDARFDGIDAELYNANVRIRNSKQDIDGPLRPLKNSSNQLPSQRLRFPTTQRELAELNEFRCDALLTFYNQTVTGNVARKRTNLTALITDV